MSARRASTDSVPVTVKLTASGGITIDPWRVYATKGQSIDWTFVGCNGRITKKSRLRGMPFSGKLPGKPKKNVKSPPTKKSGRFPYNIHLEFVGEKRKKDKIKIDPEMIIKPKI